MKTEKNTDVEYYKLTQIEDLENEIWVDMFGFDGYYLVSNLGRVKSLSRPCITAKGGYRISKEIIRKQSLYKNRLHCNISCNGNAHTLNLPAIIYFSFYPEKHTNNKKYCVMHKNKIQYDNRIENLNLETISNSHKVNFKKQLLPHLAENNIKKHQKKSLRSHQICCKCNLSKPIEEFYKNCGNKCKICKNIEGKESYLLSKRLLHKN